MTDAPQLAVDQVRRRARLLLLLDAAERAAITPLASARLHAFAYLADVLSPVWDLLPFEGKIYKDESRPHYADLQAELDDLVVLGLINVTELEFIDRGKTGARINGSYALNFTSPHLESLLVALGCDGAARAIDPADAELHSFLVELASALATLPDDQIDLAASADVTFAAPHNMNNVVDFGTSWAPDRWAANTTWQTAERFQTFLPKESILSPGEKLYLYATYLGRAMHAA